MSTEIHDYTIVVYKCNQKFITTRITYFSSWSFFIWSIPNLHCWNLYDDALKIGASTWQILTMSVQWNGGWSLLSLWSHSSVNQAYRLLLTDHPVSYRAQIFIRVDFSIHILITASSLHLNTIELNNYQKSLSGQWCFSLHSVILLSVTLENTVVNLYRQIDIKRCQVAERDFQ